MTSFFAGMMLKAALEPFIDEAFSYFSAETLALMVRADQLILPILPTNISGQLLDQLRPWDKTIVGLDTNALSEVIIELISEKRPDLSFVTRGWLNLNIEDIKTKLA